MVDRAKKQERVEQFKQDFAGATTVAVATFSGLTILETDALRKVARKNNTKISIAKNTLAVVALKGTKHEGIAPLFKTQTIITYSQDPLGAAKTLANFAKTNEKLSLAGGSFDGKILDIAGITELASVPSLDESRAQIVSILNSPARELVRIIRTHSESNGATPAPAAEATPEAAPAAAEDPATPTT